MSGIILPPTVLYNMERERLAERHAGLQWFDRQLKEIDPNLELVRVKENSPGAPNMKPGFWHARITDPVTGWKDYFPLTGPTGEFSEPHSGHLESFRRGDLRAPGAMEERRRRWAAEEETNRKAAEAAKLAAREEFALRLKAKVNPGVSFSDTAWTNRKERS